MKKIYTRLGDQGDTFLADGTCVHKGCRRIQALGGLDELSSVLGLAKEEFEEGVIEFRSLIERVQCGLSELCAEIALVRGAAGIEREVVDALEADCDRLSAELPEFPGFLLPGGNRSAALFHFARSVCRRVERDVVSLDRELKEDGQQGLNPQIVCYLNRLGDLLYVLACVSLKRLGRQELLRKSGAQK